MPNDATHRITNYLVLVGFILLNDYINFENDFKIITMFIFAYILGTEVFSPDLDTYSKPSQRLSILSYHIRKLSKHRELGHNILIGWLLKILYLIFMVSSILSVLLLLMYKCGYDAYFITDYIDIKVIGALFIGFFLNNASHIMTYKIL
jgi:uncharacterized metal-binding protein